MIIGMVWLLLKGSKMKERPSVSDHYFVCPVDYRPHILEIGYQSYIVDVDAYQGLLPVEGMNENFKSPKAVDVS